MLDLASLLQDKSINCSNPARVGKGKVLFEFYNLNYTILKIVWTTTIY